MKWVNEAARTPADDADDDAATGPFEKVGSLLRLPTLLWRLFRHLLGRNRRS